MEIPVDAQSLGEEFALFYRVLAPIVEQMKLSKRARILDVGTGAGNLAITVALLGHRVLTGEPAEDDSEYAKQKWRERARRAGVEERIEYEAFNAEKMKYADATFDAVFAMGALHHMETPGTAFSEMVRVTKSTGVICVLEPNAQLLERVREKFASHPDAVDPTRFSGELPVKKKKLEMFDLYLFTKSD